MDQKTWLWKKRSPQKSIDANIEAENDAETLQYEREAALERTVKNLHEKVASLLCECNAKDNLISEHSKTAQEAIEGRERAIAEMALQNQKLEEAVQQKIEANERLIHLNSALKDYRQQVSALKDEQANRVSDKLANLTVENARLAKALMMKEELIEDVSQQMSQASVEFNELISRLDSAEKENDILKYEYRVLERELEIRSRCADVANQQHQESMKRVVKLEAECQKLRSVVKKQITGSHDKRLVLMINRLCEVEEENKILKESMRKRDDEIHLLQEEFAQMRCDVSHGNGASQRTMIGVSEMSLMDDFVEMEKLAIVSVDTCNLDSVGKELVPVVEGDTWLQPVLKAISEQTHVSKRSLDDILDEIRVALQCRYDSAANDDLVSGYITWKSPDTDKSSSNKANMISPEKSIVSPKTELEGLQESKLMIEDQLENQKLINEELDHKLSVATVQINEANQKLSALKVELEDRSHCCEELEATCLDLQLQLASASNKDVVNVDVEQEVKQPQSGWELTVASAKLAECQETIFSIGRQLKALTPSTEQSDLTTDKKSSQHSSLRDHMEAEDTGDMEDLSSPKTKEVITATETKVPLPVVRVGSCKSRALVIVPTKKRGKGTELLRKLLFRKKRGSSKKVLTIGA
ncbi:hypothetical protein CTI12_AA177110 [Artemisia annua]|uniref:Filament-like plant protein n=1 Tax=Artemisia annua TaxID=35608 RepID=A0A2U1NZF4_ARTAN|nr:hypothetical protein CTI12_AA177110 [Artemisia annua]